MQHYHCTSDITELAQLNANTGKYMCRSLFLHTRVDSLWFAIFSSLDTLPFTPCNVFTIVLTYRLYDNVQVI